MDLFQRLQATRSSNSVGLLKDFLLECGILPRSFVVRLEEVLNCSSSVDIHQFATILCSYTNKPVVGNNVQLALIEYLSELVVALKNPPMTVHQDIWSRRDVLNMFEQLPIDETNLTIDHRINEFTDLEQQSQLAADDEQTSSDLKDVFSQIRAELLSNKTATRSETEFETIFTNEQIQHVERQLTNFHGDAHQFFKRLETNSSTNLTSIDQQSSAVFTEENLQKFSNIFYLNEIFEKVRVNDRLFNEKFANLFSQIDKENQLENKNSMSLQNQMLLARNLSHNLTNGEQTKKT